MQMPVGVRNVQGPAPVPTFNEPPKQSNPIVGLPLGSGAPGGTGVTIAATPNGAAVGDVVIVAFAWSAGSGVLSTVADTSGNTWTVVGYASSTQEGGYGYTTVTTGWNSGANTVTGTVSTGTPGGRVWCAAKIPAAFSPVFDQHNENTTTGNILITTASPLARSTEAIFIVSVVRATGASVLPVWGWGSNFIPITSVSGAGTLDSGLAIAEYDNIAGTAPVTGTATSATTSDPQAASIIAFQVTLSVANQTIAAPAATATASAPIPSLAVQLTAPIATATASAPVPSVAVNLPAPVATATASAPTPTVTVAFPAPVATATASAPVPALQVQINPPSATATASAPIPIVTTGAVVVAPAATATASAPVPTVTVSLPAPVATATASSPVATPQVRLSPAQATATASAPIPALQMRLSPAQATATASALIPALKISLSPPSATASALAPIPTVTTASGATTIITVSVNGYIRVGDVGTTTSGDTAPAPVGDKGKISVGYTGQVRI